jgi:lysyl-tRNA synthetase class 1
MDDTLTPPTAIDEVVRRFDSTQTPFSEFDVSRELNAARNSLKEPTEAENLGAWSETLAFALTPPAHENPWNTYFGPMASGTSKDGQKTYFPDVAGTPKEAVGHWSHRARTLSHPLLKARYGDLAWDMSQVIGQKKRDPEDARVAIDGYLASILMRAEPHERFQAAIRALDLASLISDPARVKNARDALMNLHREAVKADRGQWWFAVDRLIEDKKAVITDQERCELVADLEALIVRFTDQSKPEKFDPHSAQDAANRLIKHYRRTQQPDDVKRLHAIVARAFEHSASLGNAMLAAAFLQTAMDRYREAGMPDDSRRIRILMQTKIGEANAEMVPVGTEIKISFDNMEKFLDAVIGDNIGTSFARIAREFLLKRKGLEETIRKTSEQAPLMAHIPQKIMADDFVAAKIGSVEDDPFGRLFHQAKFSFGFSGVWLHETFERLLEKHEVHPEHFVSWANRHCLFEDMALLLEGVRAWYQSDFAKTTHILIPQIEVALRSIADQAGLPVTKAHPKVAGTSVAIGMGDILYASTVTDVLGPDITLHLQALFADPRGLNLRNEMAHGLLGVSAFDGHLARLLIHCLLVLGIWKELAQRSR